MTVTVILLAYHSAASGDLSANLAIRAADTPCPRQRQEDITADHHQRGIASRACHLLTAATDVPSSAAIADCDGHKAITSRNDCTSDDERFGMPRIIRLKVYPDKPQRPVGKGVDKSGQNVLHFPPMGRQITEDDVRLIMTARVRQERERLQLSQTEMADLLKINYGTYNKYETRNAMPHHVLMNFCAICGARIETFYYGSSVAEQRLRELKRKA